MKLATMVHTVATEGQAKPAVEFSAELRDNAHSLPCLANIPPPDRRFMLSLRIAAAVLGRDAPSSSDRPDDQSGPRPTQIFRFAIWRPGCIRSLPVSIDRSAAA